jgi:hypothetical protein
MQLLKNNARTAAESAGQGFIVVAVNLIASE